MTHLGDLRGDRAMGEDWENRFVELAVLHRSAWYTRNQKGNREAAHAEYLAGGVLKRCLLPDVVIWTMPGEHHEIKHKNPAPMRGRDRYGLEVYRFDALLTFAEQAPDPVMYTIHDWALAGGRDVTVNDIDHWRTANVLDLAAYNTKHKVTPDTWPRSGSYRNNGISRDEPMYYWLTRLWTPLEDFWRQHQPTLQEWR